MGPSFILCTFKVSTLKEAKTISLYKYVKRVKKRWTIWHIIVSNQYCPSYSLFYSPSLCVKEDKLVRASQHATSISLSTPDFLLSVDSTVGQSMLRSPPDLYTLPHWGQSESWLQLLAELQKQLWSTEQRYRMTHRQKSSTMSHQLNPNKQRVHRHFWHRYLCSLEKQSSLHFLGKVHVFGGRALLLEVLQWRSSLSQYSSRRWYCVQELLQEVQPVEAVSHLETASP